MAPSRGPLRLAYLDGLRALAAIYVVLFHAALGFSSGEALPAWWRALLRGFAFGHEAVALFIVLSGYCLMLPVVRGGSDRLPGGLGGYFARRALRILPPYYAALLLALLLLALLPGLRAESGTIWDHHLPGLSPGPVISHLLLVHNWAPGWAYQINGPLWSVATEWQIYFLFPLLLLAWRRAGLATMVVLAGALGYLPAQLIPARAATAIPWYLGLFALGMAAAAVGFSARPLERRLRERVPWGKLSAGSWAASAGAGLLFARVFFEHKSLTDLLIGLCTATLLVHLTARAGQAEAAPERGRGLLRLLEARPLVAVGQFSYSLYLTHLPVVGLCFFALRPLGLGPIAQTTALLTASVPASLACAYLFYRAIERPLLRARA